jgi:kynurenine formamidase
MEKISFLDFWNNAQCSDLSVTLAEDMPVSWPTLPHFRKSILNWFEEYELPTGERVPSGGYYYDQVLTIDEHSGTHIDLPSHVLPPNKLRRLPDEFANPPLKTFGGPCVIVDATKYLDQAEYGKSPRVPAALLEDWESVHGPIQPNEIVLLNTGYTDKYFQRLPEGQRLLHDPVLLRNVPGWPVPDESFFELVARRGVRHVGISSPSMGALDDSHTTHLAGIQRGITFAEFLVGLGNIPPRGALYLGFPLKIALQSGSPVRAIALFVKEGT